MHRAAAFPAVTLGPFLRLVHERDSAAFHFAHLTAEAAILPFAELIKASDNLELLFTC
jgi:hypothetical protein